MKGRKMGLRERRGLRGADKLKMAAKSPPWADEWRRCASCEQSCREAAERGRWLAAGSQEDLSDRPLERCMHAYRVQPASASGSVRCAQGLLNRAAEW